MLTFLHWQDLSLAGDHSAAASVSQSTLTYSWTVDEPHIAFEHSRMYLQGGCTCCTRVMYEFCNVAGDMSITCSSSQSNFVVTSGDLQREQLAYETCSYTKALRW